MRVPRTVRLVLALVAGLLPAPAAAGAGVTDGEIVIGTHLDLSGPVAAAMPPIRNGMQMRIDRANEAGGVNGRKLRLVVEDNASQPAYAVRAVQKLIQKDQVFAVVNPYGSTANAAAIKWAVDAGTIYFAPWGVPWSFFHSQTGKSPLVFTTVPNYDTTAAGAVFWILKNWNTRKVGVIYQDDAFGELLRHGVRVAMNAAELKPVAEAGYRPGTADFSAQIERVRQAGAELVVLAAAQKETIAIMARIKKEGWGDARVLATLPGRTQILPRLGKGAVEGLYGIGAWRIVDPDADGSNPGVKTWLTDYRKRFGADADENAMLAYSYTDWFVKGLQAAGRNLSTESFLKAIAGVEHEDFVTYRKGSFRNNHISPEVVHIERIQGGRWVAVSPDIVVGNQAGAPK